MIVAGTAALAALALGTPSAKANCLTCTSTQWCTNGSEGSSCYTYYEDGRRWCQFSLDCGKAVAVTPLDVSPAGTFLARNDDRVTEGGLQKQSCNGFVVGHVADAATQATLVRVIRI
jgi:hypothetical protein